MGAMLRVISMHQSQKVESFIDMSDIDILRCFHDDSSIEPPKVGYVEIDTKSGNRINIDMKEKTMFIFVNLPMFKNPYSTESAEQLAKLYIAYKEFPENEEWFLKYVTGKGEMPGQPVKGMDENHEN